MTKLIYNALYGRPMITDFFTTYGNFLKNCNNIKYQYLAFSRIYPLIYWSVNPLKFARYDYTMKNYINSKARYRKREALAEPFVIFKFKHRIDKKIFFINALMAKYFRSGFSFIILNYVKGSNLWKGFVFNAVPTSVSKYQTVKNFNLFVFLNWHHLSKYSNN